MSFPAHLSESNKMFNNKFSASMAIHNRPPRLHNIALKLAILALLDYLRPSSCDHNLYLLFHFEQESAFGASDSRSIYTTHLSKSKTCLETLHHSVTGKMGRKGSKMVLHSLHSRHPGVLSDSSLCCVVYTSNQNFQNFLKGQKAIFATLQRLVALLQKWWHYMTTI